VALIDRYKTTALAALITVAAVAGAAAPGSASAADRTTAKKKTHVVAPLAAKPSHTARSAKPARQVVLRNTARTGVKRVSAVMRIEPVHASFGQLYGLHNTADALDLKSSVALVLDSDTNEVLFSKNSQAVLPIASLTKLMTAVVVAEANLPLGEPLTVIQDDVDTEIFSSSRLRVGTTLSREEMLHLALMSSENRAAHALGRSYPGGLDAFVAAMNRKAHDLGMNDTHYVEPTGLSSRNQSSARDLATLVKAAEEHQMIRDFSTSSEFQVELGNRPAQFHTTNALVRSPAWDIALQKTGFINEAGRCLVMQAKMAGRKLIMVFLDGTGKYSRTGDAERVRRWVSALPVAVPSIVPGALVPSAIVIPKVAS
jgi:D-alanyl-D-alanine endopeptidase (penicillin-binding protein 7)